MTDATELRRHIQEAKVLRENARTNALPMGSIGPALALFVPLAAAVEAVLDLPERETPGCRPGRFVSAAEHAEVRGYNAALAAVRAVVVAPFDPTEETKR